MKKKILQALRAAHAPIVWKSAALPNETGLAAVDRFIMDNWGQPRRAVWLTSSNFKLADGQAHYSLELNGRVWQIRRLPD